MRTPAFFAARTAPNAWSRRATLAALVSANRPPSVAAKPMKLSSTLSVGTNVVCPAIFAAVAAADADVETVRRTDVACAQDPHARQIVCRFRSSSDEVGFGIVEPRYPVRSAEPREVRVTVDEAGNDGRSGRIDDLGAVRIGGAAIGTEVRDAAVAHEDGETAAQRRRTTVGKCRAAKEGRRW